MPPLSVNDPTNLSPRRPTAPTGAQAATGDGAAPGPDVKRLADAVSRCGVLVSERPRAAFASKGLEADLGRLLRGGCVEQYRPILERPQAAAAVAGER